MAWALLFFGRMKIASLGIAVALGAAPVVAHAQVTVSGGISFNFGSLPGEPVADTDVFYDQLSPYGMWVDDPTVGQVFIPEQSSFVPYTNGHWEDTDVGFVWVSDEPFSWATSHYGRWFYDNDYGRWAWMPDTTWGPNWVDWYETDGQFGWAPLAPDIVIQAGYQPPIQAYHYAPSDRILDANVSRYYVPRDRVAEIQRSARPVAHTESVSGRRIVTGPAPERLQAHNVRVQPKRITNAKQLGVLDRSQARTIEQRAKERKPQIEQQNQKRIEQHADIKRAVETKSQKAPNETRRTEPTRPENRTEPTRTETTRPETRTPTRTEPTRPETRTPTRTDERTQPERTTRPEPRPETTRPEPERTTPPVRTEPTKPEPQRAEPTRPEPQRAEPTRPEPQRAEPQRTEPPRPEPQRTEPSRAEPQRTEPARPEPQRTEPPRAEPKAEHAQPHGSAEGKDKRKEH